jgi:glycosyltransferase involved in cell wall biosynthesis
VGRVYEVEGVVVRQFVRSFGNSPLGVTPGLWTHLRRTAASLDVLHAHSDHVPLGFAVAHARARRLVFTPHGPIERFLRRPYASATRAIVDRAAEIVCTSRAEADLLRAALPWAARRIRVVPRGVEIAAIQAAEPFPTGTPVVLAVGRLEHSARVDRAIASMPSLDPVFRLVIVGDGPARRRLEAYAADLKVSSRVRFVGPVSDAELYRWLRTARVLVAASEQTVGLQVLEALCAGAPVVASDIPAHREAASCVDGVGVTLVSPQGSPFEIADAIVSAADTRIGSMTTLGVPSFEAFVDGVVAIYEELAPGRWRAAVARNDSFVELRVPNRAAADAVPPETSAPARDDEIPVRR